MNDIEEVIADQQHQIWAHWMRYLFSVCIEEDDGCMTIPSVFVERWKRQCATDYADLSEKEKESDRDQARKVLAALQL